MSLLKKLAGQTAVYGVSSVLGRTLNYLLVPLYTSVFAPGEYGVVTELYAYIAFLNILYIYGLETAYFRFVSKPSSSNTFNIAFTSILITSLVFSGLIYLFSNNIATLLEYPEKSNFIRWMSMILALDAIVAIPFAQLRQQGKAIVFAAFKLSNISINIGLNLFFLVLCPWILSSDPEHFLGSIYSPDIGVGYIFLSNLLANATYLLFFLPTWGRVRLVVNTEEWKRMMNYAWPILIIGFAGVTNEMLSRAILKYRLPEGFYGDSSNIEILGIFGACYKLSIFMTLAVQAFRYAFEPFFFGKADDKNSPELFSKVMTWFVIFTSFSWMFVSLLLPYIAPVFLRQDSYLEALDAVPWLLGGGVFLGIFYNLSLWYKLTDKTKFGAVISVAGAAITLSLNWFLIPIYGYMGSAFATFCSYFTMMMISYLWGKRNYPVPYNVGKILFYLGLAALAIIVNYQLQESLISTIIIIVFFLTLLVLIERHNFRSLRAN